MSIGQRSRMQPSARRRGFLDGGMGGETARGAGIALLSLVLGCAYAYLVVGGRVINPFDISWLTDDPATSYLGWAFFRQQSTPGFPIGWSRAIGYPLGEPIAYLDSMPLLAFLSWPFRNVLPQDFQYLGPWFLVCAVLQFYFGYRVSRRLCRDEVSALLGGLLFLTAPAFTWRAFGHFTLVSQWLILAGVELLLAARTGLSRRAMIWSVVLCLLAASTHPYIAAMTLLVCCAAHVRAVVSGGSALLPAALAIVSNGVATAGGLVLFGFILVGSDTSLYAGPLYGMASMNLLSVISPQQWESVLLKAQANAYSFQFEGYNYLGLGLLLLGVIALARAPAILRRLFSWSVAPMVAVVAISLLLAMSTRGTFGSHIIYNIEPPRPVMLGLQTLRASGRLFWPGYYLIFAAVLATATCAFPRRWLPAVLAVAVLVQFADLTALRTAIRETWTGRAVPVLHDPAWQELGHEHRHLVVLPAYQCGPADTPGGPLGYAVFGRIAVDQHMTINSFYAGRYSHAQFQYYCVQQMTDVRRDGMAADTAYVFPTSRAVTVAALDLAGHYCRLADDYILCSRAAGKTGLDPAVIRQVPELAPGATVLFQGEDATGKQLLGEGWSVPEPWGRWNLGLASSLSFRPQNPAQPLSVAFWVRPFGVPGHQQRIAAIVNGQKLADWTITEPGDKELRLDIPPQLIRPDGVVRIEFQFPDAITPQSVGAGPDSRLIAAGLLKMQIGG